MMRAIVLREYGDEQQLNVSFSASQPRASVGEVVVKVRACALSSLFDLCVRKGCYDALVQLGQRKADGLVLGYEISGEVSAVGSDAPGPSTQLVSLSFDDNNNSSGAAEPSSGFVVGEEVVGFVPLTAVSGGCADFVCLPVHSLVRKPSLLTHVQAAAVLLPALVSYAALVYRMHLCRGETVLVLNGASETGHFAVQYAANVVGARVIATAASTEQLNYLLDARLPNLIRVVDTRADNIVDAIMEETGGLGVDGILDLVPLCFTSSSSPAVPSSPSSSSSSSSMPASPSSPSRMEATASCYVIQTSDAIRCLSAHATWVTNREDVHLDPPLSFVMQRKSASLSFLFPQTYALVPLQQGRLLHVFADALQHVATEKLSPMIAHALPLENIRQAHRHLQTSDVGRVVLKM